MGAAGFEAATSRVSGEGTPGGLAQLRVAGVASDERGLSAVQCRTTNRGSPCKYDLFGMGAAGFEPATSRV